MEASTMGSGFISRGFLGRRRDPALAARTPPGQYLTKDFPVLSAGPTPNTPLDRWDFRLTQNGQQIGRWNWQQLQTLPRETITVDIHCVTKWSKLDTVWEGVSLDVLLDGLDQEHNFIVAYCDGGYTTNLPVSEVTGGKAWIAYNYDGEPLDSEHGGPARLLVPHLYFWKSAKWVRQIDLVDRDRPGFWEELGYHNLGDPWREQRYAGD
jgi:DMSO/TMAO reductase YedYZ molybdopterin-dependent catalytic subunit